MRKIHQQLEILLTQEFHLQLEKTNNCVNHLLFIFWRWSNAWGKCSFVKRCRGNKCMMWLCIYLGKQINHLSCKGHKMETPEDTDRAWSQQQELCRDIHGLGVSLLCFSSPSTSCDPRASHPLQLLALQPSCHGSMFTSKSLNPQSLFRFDLLLCALVWQLLRFVSERNSLSSTIQWLPILNHQPKTMAVRKPMITCWKKKDSIYFCTQMPDFS